MIQKIKKIFQAISSYTISHIILIYAICAVIVSFQSFNASQTNNEASQTKYNNYVIFKCSFEHLADNKDLYAPYPEEHWDLFKYTPTFAMLFGIFAFLPDLIGLILWNLLNALILVFAVYYLPNFDAKQKGTILIICLIEMITSIQNEQSNGLIAGLLILSFGLLENKKYIIATLCIAISIYIKLFGIVGIVMFLFYPHKLKSTLYFIIHCAALFVLPLIIINIDQYINLLQSYQQLLINDHDTSLGYSVMGWLSSWFNININKNTIVIVGGLILILPLLKIKNYNNYFYRILFIANILIWIVIFNHKAESPTFIIAIAGIALWFTNIYKTKTIIPKSEYIINISLFILAFVFVSLSPTDIFPRYIREVYVHTYSLKAVPCIFIWGKILYEMLFSSKFNPINKILSTID